MLPSRNIVTLGCVTVAVAVLLTLVIVAAGMVGLMTGDYPLSLGDVAASPVGHGSPDASNSSTRTGGSPTTRIELSPRPMPMTMRPFEICWRVA